MLQEDPEQALTPNSKKSSLLSFLREVPDLETAVSLNSRPSEEFEEDEGIIEKL